MVARQMTGPSASPAGRGGAVLTGEDTVNCYAALARYGPGMVATPPRWGTERVRVCLLPPLSLTSTPLLRLCCPPQPVSLLILCLTQDVWWPSIPSPEIREGASVTGRDVVGIVYKNEIIGSHKIRIPLNVHGTVTKVRGAGRQACLTFSCLNLMLTLHVVPSPLSIHCASGPHKRHQQSRDLPR